MNNIKWYVAGYERYQANKPNRQKRTNTLYPNEIPSDPWDIISIDLIGPLPISSEYNGILVVVDKFSKIAQYLLINMGILSRGVAQIL